MSTDTKFHTIVSPDADKSLDALGHKDLADTVAFLADTLPNIVRRDAVTKVTTPLGTIFVFQVPQTKVIVTCLNGHNEKGERVMIVLEIGALA